MKLGAHVRMNMVPFDWNTPRLARTCHMLAMKYVFHVKKGVSAVGNNLEHLQKNIEAFKQQLPNVCTGIIITADFARVYYSAERTERPYNDDWYVQGNSEISVVPPGEINYSRLRPKHRETKYAQLHFVRDNHRLKNGSQPAHPHSLSAELNIKKERWMTSSSLISTSASVLSQGHLSFGLGPAHKNRTYLPSRRAIIKTNKTKSHRLEFRQRPG